MVQRVTIDFSKKARARKVVSRSNHRVTGKYPGLKSRRMHHWESQLEQDAFRRLDMDPNVVGFREQPALLRYGAAGSEQRHYPDILVRYADGRREFVEVKADEEATFRDVVARTEMLRPGLAQLGYGYRIWAESSIRSKAQVFNARYLLRVGRAAVPLAKFEAVRRMFASQPSHTWKAVASQCSEGNAARLVLDGVLAVDLDSPLDDRTAVQFRERGQP